MTVGAATLLTAPDALAALGRDWDRLAGVAGRPYSAPGWALSWWRAARPPGSRLRTVVVRDGDSVVGVAPFYQQVSRLGVGTCRLLGAEAASFGEPVAEPAAAERVAAATTAMLARLRPPADVISLSAVPRSSPWPALLRDTWPGAAPRLTPVRSMPAPYVDLSDGFEAWWASRSRNFRSQLGRHARALAAAGVSVRRCADPDEAARLLPAFARLHHQRWDDRGGSLALSEPVAGLLAAAAKAMPADRFQLWVADRGDEVVASVLFVAAGAEVHYWLGGFDAAWARHSPANVVMVEAIRLAAVEQRRRVSLGPGDQPYKHRFATGSEELDWLDLVPRGRRSPYVQLSLGPARLYRLAAAHTPGAVKQRVRGTVALAGRVAVR